MGLPQVILSFGLIFAFNFQSGEALKCYVCSSALDPLCEDPFYTTHRKFFLLDCQSTSIHNKRYGVLSPVPVCRKFYLYKRSLGNFSYERDCTFASATDKFDVKACPFVVPDFRYHASFCDFCFYDGCNSSTTIRPSILIFLLILFIYI